MPGLRELRGALGDTYVVVWYRRANCFMRASKSLLFCRRVSAAVRIERNAGGSAIGYLQHRCEVSQEYLCAPSDTYAWLVVSAAASGANRCHSYCVRAGRCFCACRQWGRGLFPLALTRVCVIGLQAQRCALCQRVVGIYAAMYADTMLWLVLSGVVATTVG
jgi:hypothetical protein